MKKYLNKEKELQYYKNLVDYIAENHKETFKKALAELIKINCNEIIKELKRGKK